MNQIAVCCRSELLRLQHRLSRPLEFHAKNDLDNEIIEWMKHVFAAFAAWIFAFVSCGVYRGFCTNRHSARGASYISFCIFFASDFFRFIYIHISFQNYILLKIFASFITTIIVFCLKSISFGFFFKFVSFWRAMHVEDGLQSHRPVLRFDYRSHVNEILDSSILPTDVKWNHKHFLMILLDERAAGRNNNNNWRCDFQTNWDWKMIVIYEYSYLYFVLTICKISLNTIGRILNGLFMFVCFRLQFRCSLALHLF